MAIPAVRFKPFDEETNLAIADFADIQTNDIFNSPNAALTEVSDALNDLLSKGKDAIDTAQDTLKGLEDQLTRATEDIFSTVKDLTDMVPKDIEKAIADLLPDNSVLQNMFKQLSMDCKKNALGNKSNTRPYNDKFGCGSGKGKCDSAQVNGLLGKLTGGALGKAADLLNKALNSLIGLANLGYDVGLCKIFQSLAGQLDNSILSRGAAVLLGQMAGKGNTSAIIDIAGSSAGLSPLLEFPGAIGKAVDSFNTKGLGLSGAAALAAFTDRFTGGMEILQDNWMRSSATGGSSIANMGNKYNPEWAGALNYKATEDWVDMDDLDSVDNNEYGAMCSAYDNMQGTMGSDGLDSFDI